MNNSKKITVEATINAPVEEVWQVWNNPADIRQWNSAHPDWHCPASENDLREGGRFKNRMEAKDGSMGFDFEGIYDTVDIHREISYTMPDGRQATTIFTPSEDQTHVATSFDPEGLNDPEFQKQGWQAILDNFVNYAENK